MRRQRFKALGYKVERDASAGFVPGTPSYVALGPIQPGGAGGKHPSGQFAGGAASGESDGTELSPDVPPSTPGPLVVPASVFVLAAPGASPTHPTKPTTTTPTTGPTRPKARTMNPAA
jgi:hypothetical protein